jgi:hypothetical protein
MLQCLDRPNRMDEGRLRALDAMLEEAARSSERRPAR